ncbi:hypothetical protein E1200_04855 [Actinomadura sp. GC306]|uniref:hypothetical protein n=1 Tax=Actinomadura sp. GC306 TaxID=2530367 RepID=UPI0010E2E730|nr:hypothetical protein [Actinomadura sp. GC306]TDC70568.1 hypothetical protein E1200_04855 [Actinomadura sp. GC306]
MLGQDGTGLDPRQVESFGDMVEMLKRLRRQSDKSIRSIEHWGARNGYPLARSTISDVLAKKRPPRKEFVSGFIRACGIDDSGVDPWMAAWERLQVNSAPEEGHSAPTPPSFNRSGVLWVGDSYLSKYDWSDALERSTNLDIFVAYGQTWRNILARHLITFAAHSQKRMRIYLPDAEDIETLRPLAWRFDTEVDELKQKISDARGFYEGLSVSGGAQVEVYFRSGEFLFSAYRFDEGSVITLYSHTRTRASAPPALVCGTGRVNDFLNEQFDVIHQESRRIFPV